MKNIQKRFLRWLLTVCGFNQPVILWNVFQNRFDAVGRVDLFLNNKIQQEALPVITNKGEHIFTQIGHYKI
jgi:hypothetical protein